jgi:glycosyltransferase involved in cell wall biosynthesis
MKLLILDENYPHLDNLMGDVFVHVRAKEYSKTHNVKVFSFFHDPRDLVYEGIEVKMFNDQSKLANAIKEFNPDRILIHFYQSWMLNKIIKDINRPFIIWVHGYEALGWYRRLFNYTWYSPVLLNYIKKNTNQQFQFKKLINFAKKNEQIHFVFVSDWMRKITEFDTISKINKRSIIPNPIDTKLFEYKIKHPELRKRILILRSFGSNKYANDISVNAILLLSKKAFFSELQFTIIGQGQMFKKLTNPLKQFKNIELIEGAVRQIMIPELHSKNGIFLCPTRQDAQGVSMCEAMSSGLVPITSDNTAIPEFVTDQHSGFLTKNAYEVARSIELMYNQPELFQFISQQAATSIKNKCSLQTIVKNELKLIEKKYDKQNN